jgi:hypothetical protein
MPEIFRIPEKQLLYFLRARFWPALCSTCSYHLTIVDVIPNDLLSVAEVSRKDHTLLYLFSSFALVYCLWLFRDVVSIHISRLYSVDLVFMVRYMLYAAGLCPRFPPQNSSSIKIIIV